MPTDPPRPHPSVPSGALLIVHADDSLVVVDKPAGLLSVPGRGADKADNACARVQNEFADALTVHRLDMATSGLLLFARGASMQRQLSALFEAREVIKHYEALVSGLVEEEHGEIDLPLAADWPQRPRQVVDHVHGKPSVTRYRVLQRDAQDQTTRLLLQPLTGRSHQLRVHLQAIGHPIVGDALYAPPEMAAHRDRLMLHATRLEFRHPLTGDPLRLLSAAPF